MSSFTSHSLEETAKIAQDWLFDVANKYSNHDEALVVGLSGHLGAGKTAFVKEVAKILGITEVVTSPTFVIMKIYETKSQIPNTKLQINSKFQISNQNTGISSLQSPISSLSSPWRRLIHIDAYRLENRQELEVLEWKKLVADKNNLILIEWPENVGLNSYENINFMAENGAYLINYPQIRV